MVSLNEAKTFLKLKGWKIKKHIGEYPGSEGDFSTTNRYCALKEGNDVIFLFLHKGKVWTSDPYNSDVKVTSMKKLRNVVYNVEEGIISGKI